jgi:RNA polymerase sigma factor (sigma-70 family)
MRTTKSSALALNTKTMSDEQLVDEVKRTANSDCLVELSKRHGGIYNRIAMNSLSGNYPSSLFGDVISDLQYQIYQAALKFDPEKNVKFVTFLGNCTKYMCMDINNQNAKKIDNVCDFYDEYTNTIIREPSDENDETTESFDRVFSFLNLIKNEDMKKVIKMRYKSGKQHNKLLQYREIASETGYSIEWCRKLHDRGIKKLKKLVK